MMVIVYSPCLLCDYCFFTKWYVFFSFDNDKSFNLDTLALLNGAVALANQTNEKAFEATSKPRHNLFYKSFEVRYR